MNNNISNEAINFQEKFTLFSEQWSPKVIAEMNDYQFKLVKIQGEFIWHNHKDTDEVFIVLKGNIRINFRVGHVDLKQGEMYVVKKGVEHQPVTENEAEILIIEPKGIVNTGNEIDSKTAEDDAWI